MLDVVFDQLRFGPHAVMLARPTTLERLMDEAVESRDDPPYWADLWPAAHALADRLAALPLEGVRVLELGCGLALPSIVAALGGAVVTATDSSAGPFPYIAESARRTGTGPITTAVLDFADAAGEPYDLVIAADVLYDADHDAPFATALDVLVAPAGRAIVACPWTGQAERLVAALAPRFRATIETVSAPGRRTSPTTVQLVTVQPAGDGSE
jgi:predicted nicotinamide N-methyase